jgi:hypothetical protein
LFLLLIDVFSLFVSVLNQLHPISIYIVYSSVLLVVFQWIHLGLSCYGLFGTKADQSII